MDAMAILRMQNARLAASRLIWNAYSEGFIVHEVEEERDDLVERWRDRRQHLP